MDEAQEKAMDSVACFKRGALLSITGQQYNVRSKNFKTNLLVSSNRYGYVFYGTETDGLAIIPSAYIDHQSRRFVMPSDDEGNDNVQVENASIIHRSYLPGQSVKQNPSLIPYWLSLNADETILAIILFQTDAQASHLIFYDVVQYIQKPDTHPICPVMRLTSDLIGDSIRHFTWNPAIPNIFAYIDGLGAVSTFSIDKQLKALGKCNADTNNSSICWSPKGKQIVVVKYDGSLEFFDENMQPKKKQSSVVSNQSFPPCINVLWVSTHQFLLGFSTTNSNSDPNTLSHVMATYSKDQPPKTQIFYDFFFDVTDVPMNTSLHYYYTSLNQNKIVMCGLSKSMKINVIGANELNSDSYDTWTFRDDLRADAKGDLKIDSKQLTVTGMTLGLNSTLTIPEFKKKLPPCPMLLLSNSEGVLLVYYFLHQQLQFACQAPEVIKPIQVGNILGSSAALPPPTSSLALTGTFFSSQPPTNGFQMTQLNSAVAPANIPITSQGKEKTNLTNTFSFTQAPPPIANGSPIGEISKTFTMNLGTKPTPTQQQSPLKSTVSQEQPSTPKVDIKNLFQTIDQFQSKLNTLTNSLPKTSPSFGNFDKSLENLTKILQDMTKTFEKSSQSVKAMTHEHIEYMTKIENARYQLRSSLKENLYHSLKDRELDPWTQARMDSIKTKYDQLRHDLDVLLQVTHATIRDRSAPDTSEDAENEDFLPDLEISLITTGTMKQRLRNRIRELSHKVSQTENDLQQICAKLNTDILSSKTFDKTTMSSERPFHNTDAQILAHLQATHKTITQVRVPPAVGINLSSTATESTKKQSVNEVPKITTPAVQPSTPQQSSSPSVDSESFKNMLRIVRTSIDLFSGVTSPEQLQELSNTIATSPLSAAPKSNTAPISKTPTTAKAANLTKTATLPKTSQTTTVLQTPARSTGSALPMISVTPATPATQTFPSNAPLSFSQVKPTVVSATTDPIKAQTAAAASGDSAIRSLLNSTVSSSTTTAPATTPLGSTFGASSVFNQVATSSPATTTVTASSSTITTSVQSTSPTIKPLTSSGTSTFGSRPTLGGSSSLNLGSLSATMPIGSSPTVTPLTTTVSTAGLPGTAFGTPLSTAITSTASTGPFGAPTTTPATTSASTGSVFGALSGPFGTTATVTTTAASPFSAAPTTSATGTSIFGATTSTAAPSTGIFGSATITTTSPFGATPATSASGSSIFGAATPSTGIFGSTTTTTASPFGGAPTTSAAGTSIFGGVTSTAAPSTGIFGSTTTTTTSPFGATPATPGGSGTGVFGSGFGSSTSAGSPFGASSTAAPSTSTTSPFGGAFTSSSSTAAAPTGSIFGGFGSSSTASASSPTTGGFGMSSTAASPTSSTAFGAGPSFGSSFSGFNTQSKSTGSTTGFSFGGFGGQSSSSGAPAPTFASFGSAATAAPQPTSSPFGGSLFGSAAPTQPTGFGSSSFGGPSPAQSPSSASFTSYRK